MTARQSERYDDVTMRTSYNSPTVKKKITTNTLQITLLRAQIYSFTSAYT